MPSGATWPPSSTASKRAELAGTVAGVIDLRRLRDDPDYAEGVRRKGVDDALLQRLVEAEAERTSVLAATEELRAASNAASKEIGRSAPEDRPRRIAEAQGLKEQLQASEARLAEAQAVVDALVLEVPNPAHPSVPDGGEDDFRVEAVTGTAGPVPALDHAAIGEALGLVDTERAVRMSGSRFAYLMGDAVRLQFALVQWVLEVVGEEGFVPVITPVLVREEMMVDAGFFPTDRSQVYEVPEDGLFLIGTSEVGLAGLHRGERLDEDDLPVRYAGYSTCFRREAGTYGKDTRGVFRVHQFDKVEMFTYAHPDRSWDELEVIRSLQERIIGGLGLPYRVITVATGDLGAPAAKKYDLEAWLPSEQRYREVTSCSNYTDYSARRMGTRMKGAAGSTFVHTLNGTGCAIGRTLVHLFENHHQPDGTIAVPPPLRPYLGGKDHLAPTRP
jgi:seryl-tRNA synthetase